MLGPVSWIAKTTTCGLGMRSIEVAYETRPGASDVILTPDKRFVLQAVATAIDLIKAKALVCD